MGKPTGFLEFDRQLPTKRPIEARVQNFEEFLGDLSETENRNQAARCMDCGVPFCHSGCPLGNRIPEFNDAVYQGDWKFAYELLASTNNFPEFTGRICPAPCEKSCVLGIHQPPVSIEHIEKSIVEHAFKSGWVKPLPPKSRTGKKVAVIGSGPAGMAAAEQLNLAGHLVHIFERDARPGGLLTYGVPDFKLEKQVVLRRAKLMEEAGIEFFCGVEIGVDKTIEELQGDYDAVLLAIGSTVPREMELPGRNLKGIHVAMDYLTLQNQALGNEIAEPLPIHAHGKRVLVIGGGDTGSDCIGTANRQGAVSVTQITWGNKPPEDRPEGNPWPEWPMILETSSSHEEGCDRNWNIMSQEFVGNEAGELTGLKVCDIVWKNGREYYEIVEGSERVIPCELALIAVGFIHPEKASAIDPLGISTDRRGNIETSKFQTNQPGVFAAGDCNRGQSLVVWAISEGREAAREIDKYLEGTSALPSKWQSVHQL
ncbi:glutamate synthase subunit beta [Pontibacter sp. G13]|uniref:glutamate synthase subunit beta n=1 Tax=Pontibacter sp. G13 TaxID=3074898 RepID=UPI00288BF050|nr:glutamate synthase subunit beta [Pontibacter sp. G13]WNJ20947.1 glutamate synthase subunit beta [Pontibacter sp. G13]